MNDRVTLAEELAASYALVDEHGCNPPDGWRPGVAVLLAANLVCRTAAHVKTKPTHTFADATDARLSWPAPNVVRLHSAAGTAQSRAFRAALVRLLDLAGDKLVRVEISSRQAMAKAANYDARTLWRAGVEPLDADTWRRELMKQAAAWGRPAGARGGGNGHKQLDLVLLHEVGPEQLGAMPRGGVK